MSTLAQASAALAAARSASAGPGHKKRKFTRHGLLSHIFFAH